MIHLSKYLLLLILLFAFACNILNTSKVVGVYEIHYHPGYAKLELKEDSVFTYSLYTDLSGDMSYYGRWYSSGRIIRLRISSPKLIEYYDKEAYVIEEFKENYKGKKHIKIVQEDSIPLTAVNIYLNENKTPVVTNSLGEIIIDNIILNEIKVSGLSVAPFIHKVENENTNSFVFHLTYTKWIPLLLRNGIIPLKWKYLNKKLRPFDEYGKKINEFYKKK